MVTLKDLKQNAMNLRVVTRKLAAASKETSEGHPKMAEIRIAESKKIIEGVLEWIEKSLN